MNLTSHFEEHPSAFYWCVGGTSTLMLGITAICWVRLIRARRSQLFLRSSLHPRKEEEQRVVRGSSAGPAGAALGAPAQGGGGGAASGDEKQTKKKSDVRDVDVHKAVEEETGQSSDGAKSKAGGRGGDHPMERKDGTTL